MRGCSPVGTTAPASSSRSGSGGPAAVRRSRSCDCRGLQHHRPDAAQNSPSAKRSLHVALLRQQHPRTSGLLDDRDRRSGRVTSAQRPPLRSLARVFARLQVTVYPIAAPPANSILARSSSANMYARRCFPGRPGIQRRQVCRQEKMLSLPELRTALTVPR